MIPVGSWCPRAQNLGVYASLLQCISASRAACALTSGTAVPLPALPPNQGGLAAGRPPVCRSLVSPSCPHRIPATSGAAALGSRPGTGPWCWMWCEEVVSPNTAVMGEAVGAVKNHDFGVNCPAVSRANAVSKPWHFHGSRSTFANNGSWVSTCVYEQLLNLSFPDSSELGSNPAQPGELWGCWGRLWPRFLGLHHRAGAQNMLGAVWGLGAWAGRSSPGSPLS